MPPPLPESTKDAIRQLAALGGTQPVIAALTGVSRAAVDRVIHNRRYGNGRKHPHKGKLDADKVRQIRAKAGTVSNCELGREFGCSEAMIRSILTGRSWASVE